MTRFISLLFVALSVGFAALAHADFDEGVVAYDRGDYAIAHKEFKVLADQGNAEAQLYLTLIDFKSMGATPDPADGLKYEITIFNLLHRYREVIDKCTELIRLDPSNAYAFYARGDAYHGLGDDRQAIEEYDKALKVDPKYSDAYASRAGAYTSLGDKKRAMKDYNKAIEINPYDAIALYFRGKEYSALGNYKKAISDYTKAVSIKRDLSGVAYIERGKAYSAIGKIQNAIDDYNQAINLCPDNPELHRLIDNAYSDLTHKVHAIDNNKMVSSDKESQPILERKSRSSNMLKLVCTVYVPMPSQGRTESVEFIFNVDLVSSTVDRNPAIITQDRIRFARSSGGTQGKLEFVINRYTGTCTSSSVNAPDVPDGTSFSGTCRNVTERQF